MNNVAPAGMYEAFEKATLEELMYLYTMNHIATICNDGKYIRFESEGF